jgi:hypothetical protein
VRITDLLTRIYPAKRGEDPAVFHGPIARFVDIGPPDDAVARHQDDARFLAAHDAATWAAHKVWKNHDLTERRRRELLGQTEAGRAFLEKIDEDEHNKTAARAKGTMTNRYGR